MAVAEFFNRITIEQTMKAYEFMGYEFFDKNKDYNINLFGIRNRDLQPNTYNDAICMMFRVKGEWVLKKWEATTDPGTYWRLNLMNSKGTAILQPGQYLGAYHIGLHQGKYEALKQKKPMKYWRDANKDGKLDLQGKTYEEIAGTNIHRANPDPNFLSQVVEKYSAGCQVIRSMKDYEEMMAIARKARDMYTDSFTYTLFEEPQYLCETKEQTIQ